MRIDSEGRNIKNLRGLSVDKKTNGGVKGATELFYVNTEDGGALPGLGM